MLLALLPLLRHFLCAGWIAFTSDTTERLYDLARGNVLSGEQRLAYLLISSAKPDHSQNVCTQVCRNCAERPVSVAISHPLTKGARALGVNLSSRHHKSSTRAGLPSTIQTNTNAEPVAMNLVSQTLIRYHCTHKNLWNSGMFCVIITVNYHRRKRSELWSNIQYSPYRRVMGITRILR